MAKIEKPQVIIILQAASSYVLEKFINKNF